MRFLLRNLTRAILLSGMVLLGWQQCSALAHQGSRLTVAVDEVSLRVTDPTDPDGGWILDVDPGPLTAAAVEASVTEAPGTGGSNVGNDRGDLSLLPIAALQPAAP